MSNRNKFLGNSANFNPNLVNIPPIELPPGEQMAMSLSIVVTKTGNALVYGPIEDAPGAKPDPLLWASILAQGMLAVVGMSKALKNDDSRIVQPDIKIPRIH